MLSAVHALALDTVSHIAGEAPVINAEKEFDRFMKSYEFAIEAQKLKREDITNLMELVVDRMDMYHLIGALLLEFCVGFYGEFKMLEEDYVKEPKLIMEIFLLSNIAAVGYLLFAIWLSLHASVAAHAIGVEFLLDHNRLTIPTPDNLREMRQATSLFRSIYRLFQKKLCAPQQAGTVPAAPALGVPGAQNGAASSIHADLAASSVELGDPSMLSMEALATPFEDLKMPRIKNDLIKHEHRAKFAEHHRAWLRFDAYSRVAMALGINQMLQSMSYFIAGPVQKHRPSFALITVMGVQAIAFFLLKLDWRTMDTENSDDESEKPSNKRKDVSSLEGSEFIFICITYLLPPVILVLILWIAHYFFSDPATGDLDHQGRIVSRVLSTPIFFLHAIWLYLVRQSIAPHHNDLLPVRLRTVGYLDVFTRDALQELLPEEEEEPEQEKSTTRRRRGRKSSKNRTSLAALRTVTLCDSIVFDGEEEYLEHVECSGGRSSPRSHTKELSPRSPTSDMSPDPSESHPLKGRFGQDTPKHKDPARRGHDHVAWLVLGRFTTTMIWLWLFGGFIHTVNFFLDVGGSPIDVNGVIQQSAPTKILPERRRLVAQWPEPANFFEVTSLQCNSSGMVIGTPFAVHSATRAYGLNGSHGIGPLSQIGEFEMKTAWCGPGQGCQALAREAGGHWHLRTLGAAQDQSPSPAVPLPDSWQIVAAAPVLEQPGGRAALLSAWDGHRIVIASLAPESSGVWRLHRRFAVHQPLGNCTEEGPAVTDGSGEPAPGKEAAVQGLYIDTSSGCETLAVLRNYAGDGYVDGWDLVSGKHMGCWKISPQSQYGALCHDGANLLLARQSSEGPVLESTLLPKNFAQCQKSPSAARFTVQGALRSTMV